MVGPKPDFVIVPSAHVDFGEHVLVPGLLAPRVHVDHHPGDMKQGNHLRTVVRHDQGVRLTRRLEHVGAGLCQPIVLQIMPAPAQHMPMHRRRMPVAAQNAGAPDTQQIHPITLARIEAKGGVLEQLLKMRDQRMTRFIGITSHTDPHVLKTALERHDFDCTQMALNGALVGMKGGEQGMVPNPAMPPSFETVALPVATRKHMGVIAMKVFAQDALLHDANPKELLYYSLSLPVTTAVVGMPKLEHIQENIAFAKSFSPLSKSEMERISGNLTNNKAKLDLFFSNHVDV